MLPQADGPLNVFDQGQPLPPDDPIEDDQIVTLKCEDGYKLLQGGKLLDQLVVKYLGDGTWNDTIPICFGAFP